MNKLAEIRRARLRQIVEMLGLSAAAKRFGKPDRQINDMIANRKSFGEKVARDMEMQFAPSLAPGWLAENERGLADIVASGADGTSSATDVKQVTACENAKSDNAILINRPGSEEAVRTNISTAPVLPQPTITDLLEALRNEVSALPDVVKKAVADLVTDYLKTPDPETGRAVAEAIERIAGRKK